jgi:hypothetical protein
MHRLQINANAVRQRRFTDRVHLVERKGSTCSVAKSLFVQIESGKHPDAIVIGGWIAS